MVRRTVLGVLEIARGSEGRHGHVLVLVRALPKRNGTIAFESIESNKPNNCCVFKKKM
jgi:hypothetical protein